MTRWRPVGARSRRFRVLTGLLAVAVVFASGLAVAVHLVLSPGLAPLPERADAIVVFAGEKARAELAWRLLAEGRSSVVVLSNGAVSPETAPRCGEEAPIRVLCPSPGESDTRGEARMFARLAQENGWQSLIAVTGNYHVARARLLLDRCWGGATSFAAVPWRRVGLAPVLHEVGGLLVASSVARSC